MRLIAKHSQIGYQAPWDRPGCLNCRYYTIGSRDGEQTCSMHEFEVTGGGSCPAHSRLQRLAHFQDATGTAQIESTGHARSRMRVIDAQNDLERCLEQRLHDVKRLNRCGGAVGEEGARALQQRIEIEYEEEARLRRALLRAQEHAARMLVHDAEVQRLFG